MASDTRCTITVDEEHKPPRWLQVSGLRLFQVGTRLGIAFGLAFGLGFGGMAIVASSTNPNTVPLWVIGAGFGVYALTAFTIFMLRIRFLKNADIHELSQSSEDRFDIHREALLSSIYNHKRKRRASNKWFDAGDYVEAYQSNGDIPPRALIIGAYIPESGQPESECPQHIKGDPPFSIRKSKLMMVMTILPVVYILWFIISALRSFHATPSTWLMFAPLLLLILVQPLLMELQINLIFPRRTAILDRGVIEYRKFFRNHSLAVAEAICFVIIQRRTTQVGWHRSGKRLPAITLHLDGPNDPRLATILNLWTADPLPDNSA